MKSNIDLRQALNKDTGYEVSNRYTVVNTADLLSQFESNGYEVASVKFAKTSIEAKQGFQKHLIRLRLASSMLAKDSYIPEIVIKNSYDGSSSYQVMLGLFRLVCANGLIAGTTYEAYKVRHVGDIIPNILNASEKVAKQMPELAQNVLQWSQIQLSDAAQLQFAVQASSLILPNGALMPRHADLLRKRRFADAGTDLWTVYNRIQENVVHGGLRFRAVNTAGIVRNASVRSITAIDRNVGINKQLWDLAGTFAGGAQ